MTTKRPRFDAIMLPVIYFLTGFAAVEFAVLAYMRLVM